MNYETKEEKLKRIEHGVKVRRIFGSILGQPVLVREPKVISLQDFIKDTKFKVLKKRGMDNSMLFPQYSHAVYITRFKNRIDFSKPYDKAYRDESLLTYGVIAKLSNLILDMTRRLVGQMKDMEKNRKVYNRFRVYMLGWMLTLTKEVVVEYGFTNNAEFFVQATQGNSKLIISEDFIFYNGDDYFKDETTKPKTTYSVRHSFKSTSEVIDLFKCARYFSQLWKNETSIGLICPGQKFEVDVVGTLDEVLNLVADDGKVTYKHVEITKEEEKMLEELAKDDVAFSNAMKDMEFSGTDEARELLKDKETTSEADTNYVDGREI